MPHLLGHSYEFKIGMYENENWWNTEPTFGLLGKRNFINVLQAWSYECEVWCCGYFVMTRMNLKMPVPTTWSMGRKNGTTSPYESEQRDESLWSFVPDSDSNRRYYYWKTLKLYETMLSLFCLWQFKLSFLLFGSEPILIF